MRFRGSCHKDVNHILVVAAGLVVVARHPLNFYNLRWHVNDIAIDIIVLDRCCCTNMRVGPTLVVVVVVVVVAALVVVAVDDTDITNPRFLVQGPKVRDAPSDSRRFALGAFHHGRHAVR